MSSRDVEDLIVRARPEGLDDVTDGFEEMEEGLDDTSSAMEDTASGMQDIQNRLSGAMGAIVAGIATSVAFLVSTVPVVGELLAGFGAIVEAIGFRLDGILRPALSPVTDFLFDMATAIIEAEGAWGTFADIIAVATPIILGVGAALTVWAVKTFGVIGAVTALGGAIKAGIVFITGFVASIGLLPVVLAAIIIALAAFAVAYLTNWRGVRDKTDAIVNDIITGIVEKWDSLKTRTSQFFNDIVTGIMEKWNELKSRTSSFFNDLASEAAEWGRNLINRLIEGIRSKAADFADAVEGLPVIGDLIDAGVNIAGVVTGGGGGFDLGGGGSSFGARRNVTQPIFMDGRKVNNATGRFGKDRTVRRGGG